MKYIFSSSLLFAAIINALLSCTKHRGDIEEHIPVATINFFSPVASSIYHSGDSVTIKATAISTETIHGYDVVIKRSNDITKLFFQHVHDHNDTLLINQKWKNTVTAPANMEVQVILYLDHEGHTGTKKAVFKVQ